jgi:methionine-rich copper-binding protein CopC
VKKIKILNITVATFLMLALFPCNTYAVPLDFTQTDIDTVTTYIRPLTLDAIDLDKDGDTDVVIGDQYNDGIRWYNNNGSEVFTKTDIDNTFDYPRMVKVADLDEDLDYDIIASRWDETVWYRNDGSQNFTKIVINGSASGEIDFDIVDVDGDNDLDIANIDYINGQVLWYDNDGSENFTRRTINAVNDLYFAYSITAQDFDGDTDIDFVAGTQNSTIAFFRNDGSENFTKTELVTDFSVVQRVVGVQLDDDADYDVVAVSANGGGVIWLDNDGTGSFTRKAVGSSTDVTDMVVDDLDGDGDKDIIITDGDNADVLWFDNDGSENFTKRIVDSNFTGARSVDVIDVDGDTDLDVVVGSSNGGQGNPGDTLDWYNTGPDITNPTVSSLSPTDNATAASTTANLVMTFSETIVKGIGNIVIKKTSDNSIVETIDVTSGLVTVSDTTATINPSSDLAEVTGYYIQVDATAFDDASGNSYAGISNTTTWNFTTADETAPTVSTLSPTDDAVDVATTTDLVMTFDENIARGSGYIIIKKTADDSTVEAISVYSGQVTFSGTTVTINPSVNLTEQTSYYVQVASTALDDTSGNSYAGIANTTSWNFTTADEDPFVSSLSPADNATGVSVSGDLSITFNENVDAESGTIRLYKSDDTLIQSFNVTSGISGSGTATITINPTADLEYDSSYYVQIDATAFDDAGSHSYAGIADKTTWNFSTGSAPAGWISDGWLNRKEISLTGRSGAGTGFQVKLNVGESSGSSGANFHLEGNSADFPSGKNDSGDLRFTDNDGQTLLDFWVENITGTTPNRTATVWVEVADNLDSNTSIFCYYNRSGASNVSNGENTFLLFDDFDGDSLDGTKWNQQTSGASVSFSSSQVTLSNSSISSYAWIDSATTYPYPVWTETKVDSFNGSGATYRMGATTGVTPRVDNGNLYNEYAVDALGTEYRIVGDSSSTGWTTTQTSLGGATSGIWSFVWAATGSQKFLVNYVSKLTSANSLNSIANYYMYFGNAGSNAGSTSVDWARIRKYLSTEPAFSTAASEELGTDTTNPTILSISSDKADGTYGVGEIIDIDVTFSEAVTSSGSITIILETGDSDGTCTFSVSNSVTGTCNYTVQSGHNSSDLNATVFGTVQDQSGNPLTNYTPATTLADNKALVITTTTPDITNITASSVTSTGAAITWNTSEAASSQVTYGLTSMLSSYQSTAETDTSPRVTSHSVPLSSLLACTTYYYQVKSVSETSVQSTGIVKKFTTLGCTGNASVMSESDNDAAIPVATGGTIQLTNAASREVTVAIPAGYHTTDSYFQILELDDDTVLSSLSAPSGYSAVSDSIHEFRALSTLSDDVETFSQDLTITMSYEDADVVNLDENSLRIFYADGSTWTALSGCVVDTGANTVTCNTNHFSSYGLFGAPISTPSSSITQGSSTGGSGGGGGYRPGEAPWQLSAKKSTASQHSAAPLFSDVAEDHQNAEAIYYLQKNGTVQGYDDGKFIPRDLVNRAEAIKMIVGDKADGSEYGNCFEDVHGEWFAKPICYAKEQGWINGYDDGFFRPAQTVTKAELLKILLKVNGVDTSETEDETGSFSFPDGAWYNPFFFRAHELGLISDDESPTINPGENMRRGATCQYIYDLEKSPLR